MSLSDPVDARLLAVVAELGKAAVHEVAARVGMDPREVAYRLVNLSATGLPLLVGVESDPNGLRAALAGAWQPQPAQPPAAPPPPGPGQPAPHPVHGAPSGAYPVHATPPGGQPVHGYPAHGTPSGGYPVHGVPSGAYPVQSTPAAGRPVQGTPSGGYPVPGPPYPGAPVTAGPPAQGTPSGAYQAAAPPTPPPPPDPVISTWGPPQTASWARGDQPPATTGPATPRTGTVGDVLETVGLDGEQLAIQLLEVQDPADYLFGAAGYRLDEGERAVVVHTEVTNRGGTPFASLPDNYLELITAEGQAIGKAPVSLTSRPPHKIGVQPGETTGGHTVYIVPEATRIASVRWSPRPEPDERSLVWSVEG